MKANGSFKAMAIMIVLCGVALAYLYLHATSIRMTRELLRLEMEWRLVTEEVDTLTVTLEQLTSFCRLESLCSISRGEVHVSPVFTSGATDAVLAMQEGEEEKRQSAVPVAVTYNQALIRR
ncbi:MAG: hypothetical protein N2248_06375 [candidate division WOR-3 bacterium]|uniref:Uncharacterized protein n=1 Tax=candidate division WOR-3 bacterium TaxID=2052148 RepID=A0A7C1SJH3_UNCW3|nr:hypothetical protein [candidate division WOR-3 bacterium]